MCLVDRCVELHVYHKYITFKDFVYESCVSSIYVTMIVSIPTSDYQSLDLYNADHHLYSVQPEKLFNSMCVSICRGCV